jgi:hypothetical protein
MFQKRVQPLPRLKLGSNSNVAHGAFEAIPPILVAMSKMMLIYEPEERNFPSVGTGGSGVATPILYGLP